MFVDDIPEEEAIALMSELAGRIDSGKLTSSQLEQANEDFFDLDVHLTNLMFDV